MNKRTTVTTVNFPQPFTLRGLIDETVPAGSYMIETDEVLIDDLSFAAYRCTESRIHLPPLLEGETADRIIIADAGELSGAAGSGDDGAATGTKEAASSCWPLLQEPSHTLPLG